MAIPAIKDGEHFTYRDYRSWPDEERWELIHGIAYEMAGPSRAHQAVVTEVTRRIGNFLDGKPCQVYVAPFDVLLPLSDEMDDKVNTVVQPDVVVFCDPSKLTPSGARGAPDLCVEVLSPWNLRHDLDRKYHLYEKVGVREYWVVDPLGRCITIYTRSGATFGAGDYLPDDKPVKSTVLEGFDQPVSLFFARL